MIDDLLDLAAFDGPGVDAFEDAAASLDRDEASDDPYGQITQAEHAHDRLHAITGKAGASQLAADA